MSIDIILTSVAALAGAAGGLECLKYALNRKAEARKANASATTEEFRALKEYNDFLQARLVEKEQRFEEQTQLVRRLNAEVIDLTKREAAIELTLARKRCDDDACPYRQPPTALTPSPAGMTRDEYHAQKRQSNADPD